MLTKILFSTFSYWPVFVLFLNTYRKVCIWIKLCVSDLFRTESKIFFIIVKGIIYNCTSASSHQQNRPRIIETSIYMYSNSLYEYSNTNYCVHSHLYHKLTIKLQQLLFFNQALCKLRDTSRWKTKFSVTKFWHSEGEAVHFIVKSVLSIISK